MMRASILLPNRLLSSSWPWRCWRWQPPGPRRAADSPGQLPRVREQHRADGGPRELQSQHQGDRLCPRVHHGKRLRGLHPGQHRCGDSERPHEAQRDTIQAELWSTVASGSDAGDPDAKLADLVVPAHPITAGTVSFAAPANTKLEANTSYFFIVMYTTGQPQPAVGFHSRARMTRTPAARPAGASSTGFTPATRSGVPA